MQLCSQSELYSPPLQHSQASSISVLRDWTVVISRYHDLKLENMNASLRRIDLMSDILSPLAFSALLMVFNPFISIATVAWYVTGMAFHIQVVLVG